MWRNFGCGEIYFYEVLALACQVKLIDNIILPYDLFLMEFTMFCRETCFVAVNVLSMWKQVTSKILSLEKK